uniref:Uncharacterized protein n=1 Tax=Rhizophora mucronata TaxID=61149 RepID=A0A2P2N7B0_RHIMU
MQTLATTETTLVVIVVEQKA